MIDSQLKIVSLNPTHEMEELARSINPSAFSFYLLLVNSTARAMSTDDVPTMFVVIFENQQTNIKILWDFDIISVELSS